MVRVGGRAGGVLVGFEGKGGNGGAWTDKGRERTYHSDDS